MAELTPLLVSSLRRINGDRPLTPSQRVSWFLSNLYENSVDFLWLLFANPLRHSPNVTLSTFAPTCLQNLKETINLEDSPTRIVCNLFWSERLIPLIQSLSAGDRTNILEYGCGSGRYGQFILKTLGAHKVSYTGVDISPSYDLCQELDPHDFRLITDASSNVHLYIDSHDLVFTQSALEHFPDDSRFISSIHCDRSQLSAHLLPSTSCLFTYLWHGYRQYSIKRIFGFASSRLDNVQVFALGGIFTCFMQITDHLIPSIIIPKNRRSFRFPFYRERLHFSIYVDAWLSRRRLQPCSSFLAIIISSSRAS